MMRVIGRSIRGWRAGAEYRVAEDPRFAHLQQTLHVASDAFADGGPMPAAGTSPPLRWTGIPAGTASFALIVEDVDAPLLRPFVHAIGYGIDATTTTLAPGALDRARTSMGYNGAGRRAYAAPAPIRGHGAHRYVFTVLAVAFTPHFDQAPTRGRLLDAIAGNVLGLGELTGTVERS